jgi:uncharacterized membrane protein YuzA (DUF378 family)
MKYVRIIAMLLVIIGALNWGSIAFFDVDFVSSIFGGINRVIFGLVGLAGVYSISFLCHCIKCCCGCNCKCNSDSCRKK